MEFNRGVCRNHKPLNTRWIIEAVIDKAEKNQPDGRFVSEVRVEYDGDGKPYDLTWLKYGDVPALLTHGEQTLVRERIRYSLGGQVSGFHLLTYPNDITGAEEGYADFFGERNVYSGRTPARRIRDNSSQ